MAVERDGLVKRGNVVSRTVETLVAPGHSSDERIAAGVKVVAVAGTVAVAGEQLVVHAGSTIAALGSMTEPGLITAGFVVPALAGVAAIAHSSARYNESTARIFDGHYGREYRDKYNGNAERTRRVTSTGLRVLAAGGLISAGTATVAAAALALGPAIGLGHTGIAPHDVLGLAEVLGVTGGAAAATVRVWNRHNGAPASPKALSE